MAPRRSAPRGRSRGARAAASARTARARPSGSPARPAAGRSTARARGRPADSAARERSGARRRPAPRARFTLRVPSTDPRAIDSLLARQPWDLLRAPLEMAGADAEPALDRLKRYARMVLEWNRGVSNIVSRNDEQRFVERHLLESIAPAHWLRECGAKRWLDFGSGAGLPAIPLAMAGIGESWTLVESRRTKTLFLRKLIQDIVLRNIDVIHNRLENRVGGATAIPPVDGFTSRATVRLGPTLALAAPIVRAGGVAFLWKGSGWEREMDEDSAWREDWGLSRWMAIGNGPNVVAVFTRK